MAIKIKDELESNAKGTGSLMGGVLNSDGTGATKVEASNNAYDLYNKPTDDSNAGATPTTNDIYQDEISKAAKEKNYSNFYNTAMQMYNYEQNSKKYMNNALANMGLNTQGYGSSMNAGISNQAMNLYNQNLSALNQSNTEADLAALERKNAADTESDEQLVTYLNYSDDANMISNYLKNYGYTYDSNAGTWKDANGKEMNAYLKSSLDTALANVNGYVNEDGTIEAGMEDTTTSTYSSLDDLGNSKWREGNGSWKLKNRFTYALNFVKNYTSRNELAEGTIIYMTDYKGSQCYVKVNKDGSYSYANESDYLKANNVLNCIYGNMMSEGNDGRYTRKLTKDELDKKSAFKF